MAVDTGIVALVAGSSVLAAFVTQGVAALRDRLKTRKDAGFSALYLALALEYYGAACASALGESDTYEASGGAAGAAHGNVPDMPDFPDSIEWKPLGLDHTTRALSFHVEIESAKAMIRDAWDVTNDEDYSITMMREEAARLGLKALDLAASFRSSWRIEPVDQSGEWTARKFLTERTEKLNVEKKQRQEQDRRMNEELAAMGETAKDATAGF